MRDFGFGRRFPELEAIAKEEIQDVLDLLNGRRHDTVTMTYRLTNPSDWTSP
jgi:hypothetical protein